MAQKGYGQDQLGKEGSGKRGGRSGILDKHAQPPPDTELAPYFIYGSHNIRRRKYARTPDPPQRERQPRLSLRLQLRYRQARPAKHGFGLMAGPAGDVSPADNVGSAVPGKFPGSAVTLFPIPASFAFMETGACACCRTAAGSSRGRRVPPPSPLPVPRQEPPPAGW